MADQYDSFFERYEAQRLQAQGSAIAGAAVLSEGTSPDQAAKLRTTARQLGVPSATVEARPAEATLQAVAQKVDRDTMSAPTLRQKYTDAEFMRLASDDSGVLSGIERVVRQMLSPQRRTEVQIDPVMSGVQFSDTVRRMVERNPSLDFDTARTMVRQNTQIENGPTIGPASRPAPTAGNIARGLFNLDRFRAMDAGLGVAAADVLGMGQDQSIRKYETAKARSEANTPAFETSTARGLYSGGESLLNNLPGLALSVITGNPAPGLALSGAMVGTESYGKYRARGGTPGQAALGAGLESGIEVATGLLPMKFLVDRLGKAGATEFMKGLLARELPTEQIATLAQDAVDTAIANPTKTWGQYIAERPDAAYQTLLATLVQTGAMGEASAIARRLAPQRAAQDEAERAAQSVAELLRLVAASKLAQRDVGTFAAYAQALADSGDAPAEVYVDAQRAADVLAQTGVSLEALRQTAPSMVDQLTNAAPGADLRLPLAELMALGPQFADPLVDHLRTAPEAMSRAEAQEFLAAEGDKIRGETERLMAEQADAAAFRQQVDQVTTQFQQDLDAVGRFPSDVNKAYASLLGNFYAVQALRAGVPVADMLQKYPLRIVAQTKAGALLDQDVPLGQGAVETPEFRKWFGDSKVVDDQGKPLVVYHGTRGDFSAFAGDKVKGRFPNSEGFYFTSRPSHASTYADSINNAAEDFNPASRFAKPVAEGANVMPAFVRVENPKVITVSEWGTLESAVDGDGGAKVRAARAAGHDGVIVKRQAGDEWDGMLVIVFKPEQIKSAIGNRGTFDPADPNILRQTQPDAEITRGSFDPGTGTMALLAGADLSTFLHEGGHFFLEVQADLAAAIQTQISAGASVTDGERAIVEDMDRILAWFGIQGDGTITALDRWAMMTLDEKRQYHEQWARGFERFAMEGKAPSLELQHLFARFRAWLVQVYKTLTSLNVELTDDVRDVMSRMLASDRAIAEAQAARELGPLFRSPEQAGMTAEEYADYQRLAERATAQASSELDARLMKDMKWLSRARDRALKAAQAEAAAARGEVEREVRAEVMSEPVYRAWQFLTAKPALAQDQTARDENDKEIRDWRQKRTEAEAAARKERQAALYAANPDVAGLQKGQLLARNRRQIDIDVQQDMLGWDRANPQPDRVAAATEDLGPDFASGRLNTDALREMYGTKPDAKWRILSERRMTNDTGLHPDIVAEMFGFASGHALVEALTTAPAPAQVIAELTDFRTLQRHGDITSPEALQRAADEAVHNELRARVIAAELKALAKANRVTESGDDLYKKRDVIDVMKRAAEDFARQIIGRQQIRNLRPKQYAAAEARSAKLAQQAMGKSTQEAALHKRNQLVNNLATKAAYDAQDEVRKGVEFFRKTLKGNRDDIAKTRDWDMVQALRAVLAEYGIGSKGEAAQKYLEAVAQYDPDTAQVLRDRVDALTVNAKPLAELTVDEFRALHDEVRALWHLSKRSRQVEIDGKLIDIESAKIPLVQRLEDIGIPDRVPGEGRAVTDSERRLAKLRTLGAALRRVESWVDAKDGSGGIGPFRKYIWQPVKEAADAYRADKAKYLKRYRDLLGGLNIGQTRIDAPELGYTFGHSRGGSGKAEILHAILHTGNASNKRKLLLGRGWATERADGSLDTTRWDRFVQRMIDEGVLTKADFDFAQGVWDLLEEMKPGAQKTHRDVFGRYFDEVTAEPFTNALGTWRGGYVPAMTDAEVVTDAATRKLQEAESQSLAYAFPSTNRGFTKSRVEYNAPLLLDLRVLAQHIDKVLLFSHLEQPVRDVRKILASKAVSQPLHRVDPAAFDGLLTPWLNRAARQIVETPVPGDNGLLRIFSKLRSRTGMAAMMANVVNAAQQVTGLSIAAVKVRPGHLVNATAQYLRAPRQTAQAVAEASSYMAGRMENEVALMNQAIDDILLNPSVLERGEAWTARHAYFLQSAVDNVIGPIVWTGAYNQALEQGANERDAQRLADAVVRQTQGSTLPEDISRIEGGGVISGNPFVRLFTQFAGYFNMQANLMGTEFATLMREQGLRKGMGRGLYVFALGFAVPAMVSELIVQAFRGGPDDEDKDGSYLDDWIMSVLLMSNVRGALAMVPGVGPTLMAGLNTWNAKPYDDRIGTSPAISMVESAVSAPHSVYKAVVEEGSARKAVRDVATLIALTVGLPAPAIARPVGYLADVEQGRVDPTGPGDAVRGAITGRASPESKP